MVILVDPPRWPAHGTVFCHLVSDASLDELHAFADDQGVPTRAFDHDHYDVPASRYDDLVAAGAVPVRERELVARLIAGGLRVRAPRLVRQRPPAWQVWRWLRWNCKPCATMFRRWAVCVPAKV